MKNLYTLEAVEKAVQELTNRGYEIITIDGALLDNYICLPPEEGATIYEFSEYFLNEWSSAYTARRSHKISKRLAADIAAAGY